MRAHIEVVGYGIVMGVMSRNRFALDFDAGDKLHEVAARVMAETSIDLMTWPRVRSGRTTSRGYHLHARTSEPVPSEPLARYRDEDGRAKVICEVVGDGKQLVGPGSLHTSGRLYELEHGDVSDPPEIPVETVREILNVIKAFDELPPPPRRPQREPRTAPTRTYAPGTNGNEIVDRYNAEVGIETALRDAGYREGNDPGFYRHPNNDSGDSVHVLPENLAHHFGANDPFGCGETSTPFSLFAHFAHRGNWGAAVRELAERWGIRHQPEEPESCLWPSDAEAWLLAQFAAPSATPTSTVVLESLDEVEARPIEWIWPGRLAKGKLTLVCGDPGKGKSFLTLDIAARLSTGTAFPDGFTPEVGTTLLITDEDDSADTIKPRLLAMGADPRKIKRVKSVNIDGKAGDFTLAKINALHDVIRQCPDLALIVIDPLMSYFGKTKSADPAEVNALLGGLNEFASATGIAVAALVHLNKDGKSNNALYRSMGSISVIGKARLAFLVAPDRDDPTKRVLAQTKANAAAFAPSLRYEIVPTKVTAGAGDIETARVVWQGTVDVTADDLLGGAEHSSRQGAEDFLRGYLTGPKSSDEVKAEAERRGIAFRTLLRAKEKLGVRARKEGLRAGWVWLPLNEQEGSQGWDDPF